MYNDFLPLGSIVNLKKLDYKVIIGGYLAMDQSDNNHIFDYLGFFYPEGYIGPDSILVFNNEDIVNVVSNGCIIDDDQRQETLKKIQSELTGGKK